MIAFIFALIVFFIVALATVALSAILFLLVPFLIGKGANSVSNAITSSNGLQLGCLSSIVVAFVGAIIGGLLFGPVGPSISDIHVVPAFIGSVIVILLLDLFLRGSRNTRP